MTASSFSNLVDNVQSTIITILKDDATIATYTKNILDGTPTNLTKGVGYPYILVHTPFFNDKKLTRGYTPIYKSIVTVPIEIIDKKEGNCRKLTDAVRNALKSNQATTRAIKIFNPEFESREPSRGEIPTQGVLVTIYTIRFSARYDWSGSN